MYAHGISQGALTAAQGGKFQHGFFAGAFSAGAETFTGDIKFKAGKVLASSVVGGTASVLGGGKFANGAITGAYVMLFNHMAHNDPEKEKNNRALLFDGDELKVVDMDGGGTIYSTKATSGKGKDMNNPMSQGKEFAGPIPEGDYIFNSSDWKDQSKSRQVYNVLRGNGDWGDYNVPLKAINNYGSTRSSFYLHGGFFKGSAGCIDAGKNINQIYQLTKNQDVTRLIVVYLSK